MIDKYGEGNDPYTYPGTTILINKFDIKDEGILEEAEREFTTLAALGLSFENPPYDFSYLCKLHRKLFGELFDWAGETRTIDISKGDTRFCNVSFISIEAKKIFKELENINYLQDLELDIFVTKLAEFYCDLNVVHPFREGNGRAQRLLFEHIVINCGFDINFSNISKDEWVKANIYGFHCNYSLMETILRKCIFKPQL